MRAGLPAIPPWGALRPFPGEAPPFYRRGRDLSVLQTEDAHQGTIVYTGLALNVTLQPLCNVQLERHFLAINIDT
jgi:hypothetical protein